MIKTVKKKFSLFYNYFSIFFLLSLNMGLDRDNIKNKAPEPNLQGLLF